MNISELRRIRLKAWFASRVLPEKEKSYLSQLINGKASFGERAARRLERDYGMPEGYLDNDPDNPDPPNDTILSAEELQLVEYFRGFPESEKKKQLAIFETKFQKYNQLFKELSASRR
ncbi:hypothetical protein [Mixta calida]|uniref:hypothetical protein n=1 Tax=Mixta calida TaxID=665913 RepID=UPI0034D7445C